MDMGKRKRGEPGLFYGWDFDRVLPFIFVSF